MFDSFKWINLAKINPDNSLMLIYDLVISFWFKLICLISNLLNRDSIDIDVLNLIKGSITINFCSILLKNKNTVRFGDDRTIVKIQENNVMYADPNKEDKETIYKGFYTSAQITENGLYLLVLNMNMSSRILRTRSNIHEAEGHQRSDSLMPFFSIIES